MTAQEVGQRIASLKGDLEEIEGQLAKADASDENLKDLKSAVDSIRLSVWAVLTAAQADDQAAAQEVIARFRVRRATELGRNVLVDLQNNAISADAPEIGNFTATMDQVLTQLRA